MTEPYGVHRVSQRVEHGESSAGMPEADPSSRLRDSVTELIELGGLPVAEHVQRFDRLHSELQDALAAIDEI